MTEYQQRILTAAGQPYVRLTYATSLCALKRCRCRWRLSGFGPVRSAAAKALIGMGKFTFMPGESSAYYEVFRAASE